MNEVLSPEEISRRIKENVPTGVLKERWVGEIITCPVCGNKSLDKFKGGVNVETGEVSHTLAIYHCRVCDTNLTEEQYKNQ